MEKRNAGLDLVRAVAVLSVMGFHAVWFGALEGHGTPPGWLAPIGGIAVETFYTLSGFLIGRILLRLSENPSSSTWISFMGRRWARTLPLYYCILGTMAFLVGPPAKELFLYVTMTQNLFWPLTPSLFEGLMGTSWSLAVEEVFYLTFSAALLGACAASGKRATGPVILAFIILPLIARLVAPMLGMDIPYYIAVLNLDGIAWGVALAALEARGSILFRHPFAASVAGMALLAGAWAPYVTGASDMVTSWQPGSLSLASAGCCLVLSGSLRVSVPGFAGAAVRAVATRSYGIYLIHLPVINAVGKVYAEGVIGSVAAVTAFLLLTAALSWAAHKWVEIPGMAIPRKLSALQMNRKS